MEDEQKLIRIVVAIEPIISIHFGLFFFIYHSSIEWTYSGLAFFLSLLVFVLTYFAKIFEEKEDFPDSLARIRKGYFISIIASAISSLLVAIGFPFGFILPLCSLVIGILLIGIVLVKDISLEQLLSISELLTFGGLLIINLAHFFQHI